MKRCNTKMYLLHSVKWITQLQSEQNVLSKGHCLLLSRWRMERRDRGCHSNSWEGQRACPCGRIGRHPPPAVHPQIKECHAIAFFFIPFLLGPSHRSPASIYILLSHPLCIAKNCSIGKENVRF